MGRCMKRTQHVAEFTGAFGSRVLVVTYDDGSVSVTEPHRVVEFMLEGHRTRVTQSEHGVFAEKRIPARPRRRGHWRLLTGRQRNIATGMAYKLGIEEPSWEDA